jgi:uncharacterized protein
MKVGRHSPGRFRYMRPTVLIAVFAVLALATWAVFIRSNNSGVTLRVGDERFALQVANTEREREQGLGGRNSLARNAGMLFSFPDSGAHCFWMKDMKFPLDMVWLNSDKQVVHIAQNVSPQTYPHTFCSSTPARYVVELNAGMVSSVDIHEGGKLHF